MSIYMEYSGGNQRQTRATCGYMAARVKVRVCGLGLLQSRLNGNLVCDDSTTEGRTRKCGATQVNLSLP